MGEFVERLFLRGVGCYSYYKEWGVTDFMLQYNQNGGIAVFSTEKFLENDEISNSIFYFCLAWRRGIMETVKTHVYATDEDDCLLFHYQFTGLVRKEKSVQEVAIISDMWSYLNEDFHVETTDELYHHFLAQVCE